MIWLTWRQFRVPALVTLVALVVIAVILAVTGSHVHHLYAAYKAALPVCRTHGGCEQLDSSFVGHYHHLYQYLGTLLVAVPAVIGIFWGPPLIARELETGSHRLAFTQSVTRTRWLATKLAIVGGASMLTAGLLSLMVTWWAGPFDHVSADRFSSTLFGERGITPVGYAAFGFALGVTLGLLIRRTLPAMAATLAGFIAVREVMTYRVRPHLLPAEHTMAAINTATNLSFQVANGAAANGHAVVSAGLPTSASVSVSSGQLPGAWVYSTHIADNAGHAPSTRFLLTACRGELYGNGRSGYPSCVAKLAANFHLVLTYQPASRYWELQCCELGAYLALSAILLSGCFWLIRHRLS